MAEKEKTERLRQKRSAAQTAFTKRANHLTSRAKVLEERDLKAEWRELKGDHSRVEDAGFEYAMALRELEDEEATKKADQVDEKTLECDRKFDAVKHLIQNSFWTRFAEEQISTLLNEANSALDQAEATDHLQLSRKECELINRNLEREVCEVNSLVTEWTEMIPHAVLTESRDRCRIMRKRQERLWDKWAWRRSTWSDDEEEQKVTGKNDDDEESQTGKQAVSISTSPNRKLSFPVDNHIPISEVQHNPPIVPTYPSYGGPPNAISTQLQVQGAPNMYSGPYHFKPQIMLERARLPTFSGNMRDYYRWKAEWEDLQQLGNPHGLENIRKFHLIGSLDDKVKRDLVLSSCGSATDVFRLLDNKYGNKPKIVLLISKEVHGLPPVRGNSPRKTIELIQAVERALRDLQVLGEEDAVKKWVSSTVD